MTSLFNMQKITATIAILALSTLLFVSCSQINETKDGRIFTELIPENTGISFGNYLTENDSLNYFTYSYLYMGGGVSTGDINNDGLLDIFFTGNQVSNKLYLNKGNLKFEDITEKSGLSGDNRWYTGATMADVNGDGYLDIYCSVGGKFGPKENQLYLNNKDGSFTEKAQTFGIADNGNSVQGTFFDYDKDGDLDLYVANYPPTKFNAPVFVYERNMQQVADQKSDHFYRNDGEQFVDVTDSAGLRSFGLSLSATVGDLNNDSWPDIYVSNDFSSPDFMYINNGDGTFREVIKKATAHTSFYGMGADIADFDDDGFLDIFQVDMDAQSNRRKKTNMASMNPQLFWDVVDAGFQYQYMQNCLQRNSGMFTDGNPYFSNVSRITGTSSTDWSWGPLFADFDNDGLKDLFVSNGTRREINNNDYFNKLDELDLSKDSLLQVSLNIPSEKIDNFIFRNKGNLEFERANEEWGITYEGFSNGVVYADLDNDGDLEIITNNIDDYASVFENKSSEKNNYLTVQFNGDNGNTFGLGNRAYVKVDGKTHMQELTLTRGFQSSVAPELYFGLGKSQKIDELKVVWTDGKVQKLQDVAVSQTLILNHSDADLNEKQSKEKNQLFTSVRNDTVFPKFKHEENEYDDFSKQILLPHKMSTFGPAMAVGDLNNDGQDDYFIGGAAGKSGALFFQTDNSFEQITSTVFEKDRAAEDMGAIIFDADNDGDNDLYVVSGGYEFSPNSTHLQDRLYLNSGNGIFTKAAKEVLPEMLTSGSKAYASDYNGDGKTDLLVLGRQVPGKYPLPASSYLLKNTSTGDTIKFDIDVANQPKEFEQLGMATSAVFTDFNGDERTDFIIVGEWMPIRAFQNNPSGFVEVSNQMGLGNDTTGWWWSIAQGDFDQDGDVDYVVGNNGLNYKYKAKKDETFDIYVSDFDRDNSTDIVLGYYNDGQQYPLRGRECSSQQIPGIKQKFQDYQSFSKATLEEVYSKKLLASALHYQVKSFASIYLENRDGKFVIHELPKAAQTSSINKIIVDDYDNDGLPDLLVAGNLFMSEVETPRNDAGYGLYLKGNGKGRFEHFPANKSGFFVPGDVKDMDVLTVNGTKYILAVKNNDYVQSVKIEK